MEPNGFAIPTSLRTLGFSCSRVELPLPTHMRCQSMANRTPLLAQEETLLDLTAPVRALSAYLRNHSQGRRSRSASTPSASNLLALGPLLCIHTRLQKRAESVTGRTVSLVSADVLVQIRMNLHFCFAAPHSPFLPPRGPWPARTWPPPNSPRIVPICRLISSTAFSSTVFDVFHARSRCSRANSFTAAVLQLLPHHVSSPCTPLQHPPNGVLHP
jgi:hypothetical protein